jgi:hypothetical protein
LLTFPEKRPLGFRRPPGRAERAFNVVSILVLILFAVGWSWSIARARAAGDGGPVTPASANIATALTDEAPSVAYHERRSAPPGDARVKSGKLASNSAGRNADYSILGDTLPPGP